LVKNGVPWDVAFALEPDERMGMVIIIGRMDGGDFDWNSGSWVKRNA
jgi:hypothetical protein